MMIEDWTGRYPDRSRLDAQFTLDSIADLEAVFARRTAAGGEALRNFRAERIRYGEAPAETLLLFPSNALHAPVQLFIHGGFWMSLEASQFAFLAPGFVPFGAALILIDYPLIPAVRMADIVASCRRAIGWVWRHGAAHGLDPERLFISGNSAGGHLVAEMIDRHWTAEAGLPPNPVKGGVAVSGLYDLAPVGDSFKNDDLHFTGDEIARFSPLRRQPDIGAPLIVAVGGDETQEFLHQSAAFARHCAANGAAAELLVAPARDHITIVLDSLARPGEPLNRLARIQMGVEAAASHEGG